MILLPQSPSCWDYISVTIWTQLTFSSFMGCNIRLLILGLYFCSVSSLPPPCHLPLSLPLPTPLPTFSPSSSCPRDWGWSQDLKDTKKQCYHWATSPIPFFSNRHFIATNTPLSIILPKFLSFSILVFVLFNSKYFLMALVIFFQLSTI